MDSIYLPVMAFLSFRHFRERPMVFLNATVSVNPAPNLRNTGTLPGTKPMFDDQ